ncbi:phage terminase small subunit [Streptomyces griseoruber]|uniref:phage terminase small subunit n=1 Tax=Streptomyces griseoruber TaxID=1943 RepID=UPI0037B8C805
MAGRGPAPKDPTKRRRRNASEPETVLVPDDELRGPELPTGALGVDEDTGEVVVWHPMTRLWWDAWRRSPMAQTFGETDWLFLIDTALMHHTMWAKGRWEFASEVRLRAAKFGATPEDRARLKLKVDDPVNARQAPAERPANVSDINSRRARLTG